MHTDILPRFQLPGSRYWVLVLATLCLTSINSNMNTYNFTKICTDSGNSTRHEYSRVQKSALQSAVAVGALLASLPFTYMFQKYPHRYIFGVAGGISAIATSLIPLADSRGFGWLYAARVGQGIAYTSTFPIIGAITTDWAALGEHGLFIALLTGCSQLSNMFTMSVSGALCASSLGWRSVYYLHAGLGFIVFFLWLVLYRDNPNRHPWSSTREVMHITDGKHFNPEDSEPIPYLSILKSKTIWGCWIAAFGDLISINLVSMFNPQYMKEYLDFDVMSSGFLSALPVITQFVMKVVSGVSSDYVRCIGETTKLKVYNTLALGVAGIFFIVLGWMPRSHPQWCVVVLVFTESVIGFNTAGFNKCATLHSRQHSHFVMTQIMNIASVCILIEPFLVNVMLSDPHSPADWRLVFSVHAGILLLTNAIFCVWADARPAWWTRLK